MQLASLPIEKMTKVVYPSKQVARILAETGEEPRVVYYYEGMYYKIWKSNSRDYKTVYFGGKKRIAVSLDEYGNEVILGFKLGLYDESICPAFFDHIYDDQTLVGYATLAGEALGTLDCSEPYFRGFLASIIERTIYSGVAYRDLKARNVVRLPCGRLSLIDLECPPVVLSQFSVDQESRHGSLAGFTCKSYRDFIISYLSIDKYDRTQLVTGKASFPPKLAFGGAVKGLTHTY